MQDQPTPASTHQNPTKESTKREVSTSNELQERDGRRGGTGVKTAEGLLLPAITTFNYLKDTHFSLPRSSLPPVRFHLFEANATSSILGFCVSVNLCVAVSLSSSGGYVCKQ